MVYVLFQPVNVYKFMNDTFVYVITTFAKETKPSGRRTPSEMQSNLLKENFSKLRVIKVITEKKAFRSRLLFTL